VPRPSSPGRCPGLGEPLPPSGRFAELSFAQPSPCYRLPPLRGSNDAVPAGPCDITFLRRNSRRVHAAIASVACPQEPKRHPILTSLSLSNFAGCEEQSPSRKCPRIFLSFGTPLADTQKQLAVPRRIGSGAGRERLEGSVQRRGPVGSEIREEKQCERIFSCRRNVFVINRLSIP
jgi:hypothetical protein